MNFITKINHLSRIRCFGLIQKPLGQKNLVFNPCRKISFLPGSRTSVVTEKKLLEKDEIPVGYRIIYRAPMENYLKASKIITTITAVGIGLYTLYEYDVTGKNLSQSDSVHYEDFFGLVSEQSDLVYFAIGFIFVTIALRVMLSKYPLRIYRKEEKYIAVFEGQIPFINSKKEFYKGEVAETKSIFLNPWRESMYKMKDTNVILLLDYFRTSADFTEMFK